MQKTSLIILMFFLIFSISCQTQHKADRQAASEIPVEKKSGRHFIITVHGFHGAPDNFGQMKNVLVSHLKRLHPEKNYQFLEMSYPTGTDSDAFNFAYHHLSQFLNDNIKNPTLNDSLVFIAHSQGGIVTSIWKAAAQYGLIYDPKYKKVLNDRIYAQITDQFITLGTPFWGSNQAQIASNLNILRSVYDKELKGMSFNSDLILWMRHLALALKDQNQSDVTEYTNIAGIIPNEKNRLFYQRDHVRGGVGQIYAGTADTIFKQFARRYSFSSEKLNSHRPDRFESDLTVLVPSTRARFYFAEKKLTCENETLNSDDFQQVSLFKPAKYILTEGYHVSLFSQRLRSIADVPAFCIDPAKCNHPTYRYILDSLANCQKQTCNPQAQSEILDTLFLTNKTENEYNKILTSGVTLQGFSLDVNIQLPIDYELPEKYYRDLPYTENETAQLNQNGEEMFIRSRKYKTLNERKFKNKKIVSQIFKLDTSSLSDDLKNSIDVQIVRRREGFSGLSCWGPDSCPKAHELRLHITGWLKPKSLEALKKYQTEWNEKHRDGFVLPFTLELPSTVRHQFKKTQLLSRVNPGHSTFVKLNYLDAVNCDHQNDQPLLQK